jgi:hypothetical protein
MADVSEHIQRHLKAFSTKDLELLVTVLAANDTLMTVAHAVKQIERSVAYPVTEQHQLLELLGRGPVRVGDCRISADQVREFLPQEAVPMVDREDLISRLVIAIEAQRWQLISDLPEER